jgi:Zn-dependent protease with chaperone function
MYRVNSEGFALFFGIILSILIAYIFSTINFWIFLVLIIIGLIYVKLSQAQELGNSIRVHENQFPEIYEIFKDYAQNLGIGKANLYIKQDPYLNAFTIGFDTCTVILNSALVEQLSIDELKFVIGHELGHYKSGHTKITTFTNPLGQGNIYSNFIFGFWGRKAEYSCDRCGILLTKDIDSAISATLKLSLGANLFKKFNIDGYIPQLKKSDSRMVRSSELLTSHPTTANRIRNIMSYWNDSFKSKK